MAIVAVQNLGGLGATEGAPVLFTWTPTGSLPHLLPWLGLLGLMLIPRNRDSRAWGVWVAVFCGFGLQWLIGRMEGGWLSSQPVEMLRDWIVALSFGLGAMWLLWSAEPRGRFRTFFTAFLLLGCSSVVVHILRSGMGLGLELFMTSIILSICALTIPLALMLAGACCGAKFRPLALLVWLTVWSLLLSAVATSPFLLFALVQNAGAVMWGEALGGVALLAGIGFGAQLPFIVLARYNGLFARRLSAFLRLGEPESTPILTSIAPPLEAQVR